MMTEIVGSPPRSVARAGRSRTRRWGRAATFVVGLALLVGTAVVWPARAGGRVTYVTTSGTSMEPRFHRGDLALLLPSSDYRVGDIVAYHSATLDTVVMHRIVAVRHGHYQFKGDDNSWIDPDTPTRRDLIGKLWLRIPHGAVLLLALRNMAVAGVVLALIFYAFPAKGPRKRNLDPRLEHASEVAIAESAQSGIA